MTTTTQTYTSDPARVTGLVWYISSESVADYDHESDEYVDDPVFDGLRMIAACEELARLARIEYPNLNDWSVSSGGFENQYAPMSPRAYTNDYHEVYEFFYDDMDRLENNAIAHALKLYPIA